MKVVDESYCRTHTVITYYTHYVFNGTEIKQLNTLKKNGIALLDETQTMCRMIAVDMLSVKYFKKIQKALKTLLENPVKKAKTNHVLIS